MGNSVSKKKKEDIPRFTLRWPESVRDKIVKLAKKEGRSINKQIVHECDKREVGDGH